MKPKPLITDTFLLRMVGDDSGGGSEPPKEAEPPKLNEHGYPDNTPHGEMTLEQQVAYWKRHTRNKEERLKTSVPKEDYDTLVSELDKARQGKLPDADRIREDGKVSGYREAVETYGPRLVRESMRAAVAGRVPEETLRSHLEFVDLSKFLNKDGDVETEKVEKFAAGLVPAEKSNSDLRGWVTSRSGADREDPPNGSHSVASAKEAHLAKLRGK